MAAEVIRSFIPKLVTLISDCVQVVSDECLAKGLVTESVYRTVLESEETGKDKARTLLLAVKNSIEVDNTCFDLFLNILEGALPFRMRESLLSKLRNERATTCSALVPSTQDTQLVPRGELPRDSVLQQTHLLGRLEDTIRQHERACAEKKLLEERLKVKTEKYEKLKLRFEAMKNETQTSSAEDIAEVKSKMAVSESVITNLKARVEELEKTLEDQFMLVRRGRNTLTMKTKEMITEVAQVSHAATREKAEEEMRLIKREHELAIQEKDLRIRELEAKAEGTSTISVANPPDMIKHRHVPYLYRSIAKSKAEVEFDIEMPHWRNFGLQLGFSSEEMDGIRGNFVLNLMYTWIKWFPGDSRGSTTFATYSGLKTTLVKSGLGDVARDLISYEELEKCSEKH